MPRSAVRPLPPAPRTGPDVLSPAAALTLAIVGTTAAAMTVARLTQTLANRAPTRAPEPASLVWEG